MTCYDLDYNQYGKQLVLLRLGHDLGHDPGHNQGLKSVAWVKANYMPVREFPTNYFLRGDIRRTNCKATNITPLHKGDWTPCTWNLEPRVWSITPWVTL